MLIESRLNEFLQSLSKGHCSRPSEGHREDVGGHRMSDDEAVSTSNDSQNALVIDRSINQGEKFQGKINACISPKDN
jgi:hypothetical protein